MSEHATTEAAAIGAQDFRRTLGQFATGVIVITTEHQGEIHGMTANAFMSGSMSPPLVIVSVDKRTRMHGYLRLGGHYGVSVLAGDQEAMSRHFGGQPQHNHTVNFSRRGGQPVLDGALAWIAARIVHEYDCGDHTLFVGHVNALGHAEGGDALGFHRGRYTAL
ncbi:flavin reductase family protein [Enterobacillus tribolii]|uniref:Flavin reductase (DIM6/NTAB) family NADH-FMN oxidoreductase RutF n=1 Tax=Enterobacillus tribolii TaxID=1487935 RepID=A0A370R1E5_9GAMM|nr:flavin reductase family protein [Enterobacillus tribolii]MBW7982709.1 flavin reductase [Enterobacillus tribolii]RDK95729.1 flavin reductase (DIM6/NTAB) family NADH-FMN oxidoreductase RutF [Enterobacillus tribolii]